ncbi:hypothetical protein JCM10213_008620 [Rhodosporidiobolus nylandii]
MFDQATIRTGGDPFVYSFVKIGTSEHPFDDRITGPSSSYTVAYEDVENGRFEVQLRQEGREGPLRVVVSSSTSSEKDGFALRIPDRDFSVRVFPGQPFAEVDAQGKSRKKAAQWKRLYETGDGIVYVNQDFSAEREFLLGSAIGIAVSGTRPVNGGANTAAGGK